MKPSSLSVLLALLPLALAAPSPVVIGENIDDIAVAVDPVGKRQLLCKLFSSFATPNPAINPTSVTSFQTYQPWQTASGSLGSYGLPIYEGLKSVGIKNGLLSTKTYKDYDPNACKATCDSMTSCASFAIWRERVPMQLFAAFFCPKPSLEAAYQTKCVYFGFKLAASDATSSGYWTNNGKFNVVQTSVKFFNKNAYVPGAVDGFSGPSGDWGKCAPEGLTTDGADVETAAGSFHVDVLASDPGPMTTAIDPSFCASTCKTITSGAQPDATSGIKLNCNMFSLSLLRANGKDTWQCQYFTKDLDASRNTACKSNKNVVASWKYVSSGSNAVAPYVNTKPPQASEPPQAPQIPQCTGSDSSTFDVTCIEDFKNIVGRSDTFFIDGSIERSDDRKPDSYSQGATELAGFSGSDMSYLHNGPNFFEQDATRLVGDGFFGRVAMVDGQSEIAAGNFRFDLESIDLATWYLQGVNPRSRLYLQGLRDGEVVAQSEQTYRIPTRSGQDEFAHATGLVSLGFTDLDGLPRDSYTAFDNIVLTRRRFRRVIRIDRAKL